MPCRLIVRMSDDGRKFNRGDVVEVLNFGQDPGRKIRRNIKFRAIDSDMDIVEAQVLLEEERDPLDELRILLFRKRTLNLDRLTTRERDDMDEPTRSEDVTLTSTRIMAIVDIRETPVRAG